jgi:hypothetical protein
VLAKDVAFQRQNGGIDLEVVMEFPHLSVSRVVPTRVLEVPEADITAVFSYSAADPYAVVATFGTSEGEISWVFARDLLKDGLRGPAGMGDICVRPGRAGSVWLTLNSPAGAAQLECDQDALAEFVAQMFAQVPSETESEYIEVEGWIADLIANF